MKATLHGEHEIELMEVTTQHGDIPGLDTKYSPESKPAMLSIDTTRITNGLTELSVTAILRLPSGRICEVSSQPIKLNIFNEISFPDWEPLFGTAIQIRATSAHPEVDYEINIMNLLG